MKRLASNSERAQEGKANCSKPPSKIICYYIENLVCFY